jgi:L-ascorbate metabolism protein UlaG (beta-lactamase superfamily)
VIRRPSILALAAFATIAVATSARAQQSRPATARATSPITVRWLGHASFEIVSSGGTRLLIDPWFTQSPVASDSVKATAYWTAAHRPSAILVSHSHFDHAGDAKAIAQASGAPVVGTFDYVGSLGLPEAQVMGGNVGGSFRIGDVTVHLVPAMHSSDPGGRPLGFVLVFADGRALYHTGDTWIFGDMALVQERFRPGIVLMNTGGGPFTQDPATAALAARKYFPAAQVVPMHFATFPALATEAQVRAAFRTNPRLRVMTVGETRTF